MPKIFLSYSKEENGKLAGQIKVLLEEYPDITCFVAHDEDAIEGGAEWEAAILKNLRESQFFMPIQTVHLVQSFWCQQEAGIAKALDIKIVPLMPDDGGVDPVGFYARFQGVRIHEADLRGSIRRVLLQQNLIEADSSQEEIEKRFLLFEGSDTWADAAANIRNLLAYEDKLTDAQIKRIARAAINNDQIRSSYAARPYLSRLFAKRSTQVPLDVIKEFSNV